MKTNNDIQEELSKIAPILASVKKANREEVSADYFVALNEKLLQKIRKEEVLAELKNIAPVLSSLEKTQTQVVPARFFEGFPDKVFATIQMREKQSKKRAQLTLWEQVEMWVEKFLFTPRYTMALATVISAVVLSGIYFSSTTETQNNQQLALATQSLSKDDIETYMLEYSDEFEEAQLENQVVENNADVTENPISAEDVRAYFEEENISIDDLAI